MVSVVEYLWCVTRFHLTWVSKTFTLLPAFSNVWSFFDRFIEGPLSMSDDSDVVVSSANLGIFTCSLVYIAAFLPLGIFSSINSGLNPINVLLFLEFPDSYEDYSHICALALTDLIDYVYLFCALGLAYGNLSLMYSTLFIPLGSKLIKNRGFLPLFRSSYSFLFAFLLTDITVILITGDTSTISGGAFIFQIFYLYFGYFVIELFRHSLSVHQIWSYQFNFLLDGIFTLYIFALISHGYSDDVAIIISTPIFLIWSFFSLFFIEHTFVRLFISTFVCLRTIFNDTKLINEERRMKLLFLLMRTFRVYFRTIGTNIYSLHESFNELFDWFMCEYSSVQEKEETQTYTNKINVLEFLFAFVLWGAFPVLAFFASSFLLCQTVIFFS